MYDRLTSVLGQALCAFGKTLKRARRGNIAMIFALIAVPIIVTGGAGIDLARALAVRTKLYTAVDAAALAVASKSGISQSDAETLAQQYFNANYKLNNSFGTPAGVNVAIVGQSVTVSVQSDMPTTLMNVAGFQNVNLTASSNVVWGQNKIWVGLALDNTGSMCEPSSSPCTNPGTNTKIYALKTATKTLLSMFQTTAVTAGDVQVSLIPFSRDVKVDPTANASASWIDWSEWDETHGSCVGDSSKTTQTACVGSGACTGYSGGTAPTSSSSCASAGTCSVSGNTTSAACGSAGTCSVSGFSTSSTTCANAGSCSVSGFTTQGTCQAGGVCSNSSYSSSQSYCTSNYVNKCSIPQYTSQSSCESGSSGGTCSMGTWSTQTLCQAAYVNVCSITGYLTQSTCQAAYVNKCSNPDVTSQTTCTGNKGCSISGYNSKNPCQNAGGTWATGTWNKIYGVWGKSYGVWTPNYGVWGKSYGVWTAGVWSATPGVWTAAAWTPATWTARTWVATHTGWNGCIADRGTIAGPSTSTSNSGYDIVNTTPSTTIAESRFPAENYSSCPTTLMGLSYDWTTLDSKVDAMVAAGNTNQTVGLAWAWQSLTQGLPLSPPSLPTNTARHIIILSDGENTANRWYGSSETSKIDDRMHLLCTNAKNDGITVWAVFVDVANSAGSAASMEDCATGGANGGKYIKVTSAAGIGNALSVIGQQITNLRVAH